ncbi:uncharacterized protein LOC103477168 [Poecilia reticulata]|uniref:uncharacterized protein LOC103477168 n=1 Tax=Poecilia reticulata TaxID=8081 RepID=UPI0004A3EA5C|nr:PREDICTED: uncharacterized protein LOC103477168 [Poecilia reticulata]
MEFSDSLIVIIWINVRFCLPFTFLLIALCCLVRLDRAPVSYYMNLLLSNLVQLIILIALPRHSDYHWKHLVSVHIYACCALASLYFRTVIALERCFLMSSLLPRSVTQTKRLLIVCLWAFSFGLGSLFLKFLHGLLFLIFMLLPAPVFIVSLLWTLRSTNTNLSVSSEEKDRTMGMLLVLLVNYFISIFPAVIYCIYLGDFNRYHFKIADIFLSLFLLGPCLDLILFVFMCEGLIDKLLLCLCSCRKETSEGSDLSSSSV